jgi:hypothetical protein
MIFHFRSSESSSFLSIVFLPAEASRFAKMKKIKVCEVNGSAQSVKCKKTSAVRNVQRTIKADSAQCALLSVYFSLIFIEG